MEGRGSDISSAWNGLTHGIMICTTQGGTAAIFDYVTPVVNVDDDDKADDEGGFDGDDTQDEGKNDEDVPTVIPEEQPNIKVDKTGSPLATSKTSPKPSPQLNTPGERALVTAMSETSRKWAQPDPQNRRKSSNLRRTLSQFW